MLVSHDREKLLNAIIYFSGAVKHCHTLKLLKLLYFSDFEHFRQTGRTIFGLEYRALDKGPVPLDLLAEIDKGGWQDMKKVINVFAERDHITNKVTRRDIKARAPFDKKYLSKRELKIMERIAEFFYEFKGEDMSEFSHMKHLPWRTVYKNGEGRNKLIPADLALESDPLVHDVPTIDRREVEFRQELARDGA